MFTIKGHKLHSDDTDIIHVDTRKKSGKINPKFIVIHYTAGASFEGDLRTLSSSSVKASCHIVIGPDGEIGQVARLNDKLWHAGRSTWRGHVGLNNFSIGIEVTNPGGMKILGNGRYLADFGKVYSGGDFVEARHPNGGPVKGWKPFNTAQMNVLNELVPFLVDKYGIEEVVGHDMISPTRKIDPGPCLNSKYYEVWMGRDDDADDAWPEEVREAAAVKVPQGDFLAVRRWPSPASKEILRLASGQIVRKIRNKEDWWLINIDGTEGWVNGNYLVGF